MENSCLIEATLYNNSDRNLIVKSPDITELNGTKIPPYHKLPITIQFSSELKLNQERWIDKEGNVVIYLMLVDKDY